MRVKMKTTMSGPAGTVHAGAVTDVDAVTASALIDGGFADAEEPMAGAAIAVADADGVETVLVQPRTAASVEIPEEWRTMPAKALKALADQLVSEPVKTRNEAISTIEAELASRGNVLFSAKVETASFGPDETAEAPRNKIDE